MLQKKNNKIEVFSINELKLFRDDIEYLINRLHHKSLKVIISNDDMVFEDLEELIKLKGSKPARFEISGTNENEILSKVWIDFRQDKVSVSSYGSDDLYSFTHEIKGFLAKKIISYNKIFNPNIWRNIIFVFIFIWSVLKSGKQVSVNDSLFAYLIGGFSLIFLVSVIYRKLMIGINLVREHEHGFLRRNSDAIVLMIASALVGGLFTLLIDFLLKK